MDIQFADIIEGIKSGVQYIPATLTLSFVPLLLGLLFGSLIAAVQYFKVPFWGNFFRIIVTFYSGIPIVVALLAYNLIYLLEFNKITAFLGIAVTTKEMSPLFIGVFALTLSSISLQSETVRSALLSVDKGQFEAGYACGLTRNQVMTRIIIPQMIPVLIPPFTNHVVGAVKNTSIVMSIGIIDVLTGSLVPAQTSYCFIEGYIAAAIIYWCINLILELIMGYIERKTSIFKNKNNKENQRE